MEPVKVKIVQVSSPEHFTLWNAFSAESLAGDLRGVFKDRVDVSIDRIRKHEDIGRLIYGIKVDTPRFFGLSVEPGSLLWVKEFVGKFKLLKNKPTLLFGNKLPTYFPEYFTKLYPSSIVIVGEGEESFRGLIECCNGRGLNTVPNLVYNGGRTEEKPLDLCSLIHSPSMDSIPDLVRTGTNALLQASRGCSWAQCSYCTIKSWRKNKRWEELPFNRVMKNIENLVACGVSELEFADDDFFGGTTSWHLERLEAIAEGIERIKKESGKDISFRIFVIPHTIYREGRDKQNDGVKKTLERLRKAGLVKVYFGVESGSDSQLKRYRRGYRVADIEKVIAIIRDEMRFDIDVGFIMFDPFLTLDEMMENVKFFRKQNLVSSNQWPFRPLAVNTGSYLFSTIRQSSLMKEENINFMRIENDFEDDGVSKIYKAVDLLSKETRSIFYALKVFSKRQFDFQKKDRQTLLCQGFIEANAFVFLSLMEDLYHSFQDHSSPVAHAKQKINAILAGVEKCIREGDIIDESGFILNQVANYKKGEESQCQRYLS